MVSYQAEKFADVAVTDLGKNIWQFLLKEEYLKLMIKFSESNQAAILAVEADLASVFAESIVKSGDSERIKTMCLNMVRQIMEDQGYVHIACVFLSKGHFFSTAGVFRKN